MRENPSLEERLTRLEREGRRWRRAATLLGLLLLGSLATGFARRAPDVVEAQRFVLRGADGAELAVLGPDPSGAPMLLLSEDKESLLLTLSGPALSLRGADGKRGVFLGVDTHGDSRLELRNERYLDGVRLVSREDGTSGVYLLDGDGNERGATELTGSGNVLFSARDAQRHPRAVFGLDENETPNLVLLDAIGRRRVGMLLRKDVGSSPLLDLEDGEGRSRATLTLDLDGNPGLTMTRPDGQKSFQAP